MKLLEIRKKAQMTFGVKEEVPSGQTIQKERTGSIKTPSIPEQTGVIKDPIRDAARSALLPGKRLSKTGKVYWETRKNRSDALRSRL